MHKILRKLRDWYGPPGTGVDHTGQVDYCYAGFSIDSMPLVAQQVSKGSSVAIISSSGQTHRIVSNAANRTVSNEQFFSTLRAMVGKATSTKDYRDEALWSDRGKFLFDMGWKHEALECFLRALALDENFPAAWTNLGQYFMDPTVLDFRLAAECCEKSLALSPDNDVALGNLGGIAFAQKKFGESIEYSKKAIARNERNFHGHYYLACALMQLSQECGGENRKRLIRGALREFRRCTDLGRESVPQDAYEPIKKCLEWCQSQLR